MLTLLLSYLGGVLTIFSPCVLPVIPFIFSRSDQPFRKSGLPMLVGMALSFALFAALSVAGGRWVVQANQIGRTLALIVFAVLGVTLLFPRIADRLMAPFVRLGGALQKKADAGSGIGSSLLLGASIGLLWAPCAGPILGLVLAGAALGGSNQKTFGLLFVFALGAATSLGIAIRASGKLMKTLKKGLGAEEWIKRGLGVAVLCAVVAISLGLDTKILAKLSYFNTGAIEQNLVDRVSGDKPAVEKSEALTPEGPMPSLQGAALWLNSPPLTTESLRGKVVLIDFWTYSCINCLRTLPYIKAWSEKYRDQGLVIIGIHAPEFAFEKDEQNVRGAVRDLGITYPVALDNDLTIWNAFKNEYWPAHYFIDTQGQIRHHHFGEGGYEESEQVIQALLKEAHVGKPATDIPLTTPATLNAGDAGAGTGIEAPASNPSDVASPETYVGYDREEGFVGKPGILKDAVATYQTPSSLQLNHWAFSGAWKISAETAHLQSKNGSLSFRFKARDLHLVIGAPAGGGKVRYRVTLDGQAPGADHGMDTDESGAGTASGHRLYQLIRLKGGAAEHTFRIEFLDPGAEVFAFTFG